MNERDKINLVELLNMYKDNVFELYRYYKDANGDGETTFKETNKEIYIFGRKKPLIESICFFHNSLGACDLEHILFSYIDMHNATIFEQKPDNSVVSYKWFEINDLGEAVFLRTRAQEVRDE